MKSVPRPLPQIGKRWMENASDSHIDLGFHHSWPNVDILPNAAPIKLKKGFLSHLGSLRIG